MHQNVAIRRAKYSFIIEAPFRPSVPIENEANNNYCCIAWNGKRKRVNLVQTSFRAVAAAVVVLVMWSSVWPACYFHYNDSSSNPAHLCLKLLGANWKRVSDRLIFYNYCSIFCKVCSLDTENTFYCCVLSSAFDTQLPLKQTHKQTTYFPLTAKTHYLEVVIDL